MSLLSLLDLEQLAMTKEGENGLEVDQRFLNRELKKVELGNWARDAGNRKALWDKLMEMNA